jgi:hypothetical protein
VLEALEEEYGGTQTRVDIDSGVLRETLDALVAEAGGQS